MLADTIVLQESDSAFLGRVPHTFVIGSTGQLYIVDQSTDRVLVFSPAGSLQRIVGHHGSGPGEFSRIGPLTIPLGPQLIQGFLGNTLAILNENGTETGRLTHTGYAASWSSTDAYLVLGIFDPKTTKTVALIGWDSVKQGSITQPVPPTQVDLPIEYQKYPGLEVFNQTVVLGYGDTLIVGFGATDHLTRMALQGGASYSIDIPVRQRRGASGNALAPYRSRNITFYKAITGLSNLLGIWRMSDGNLVLWHQEGSTEDEKQPNADIIGHAYLSVLSPDLKTACVDGLVQAPGNMRTRLSFGRDTIYSFDQNVVGVSADSARVKSVVRKYSIDLSSCRWMPIRNQ